MAVTQYIGSRYVPLFADPIDWNITRAYESLTIVYYQGNSYTSKQAVPTGIDITNTTYWALTGNYNAQVEQYRREVQTFDGRITANAQAIADEVTARMSEDTAIRALITTLNNDLETEESARETADTQIRTDFATADTQIRTDFTDADTALGARIDVFKYSKPLNVLAYGVKNDGSEDVSALINELTAQAPLYFPSGTYRIDNPVYIKNSICGDGYNKLFENNGTQFISNISEPEENVGMINLVAPVNGVVSLFIDGISVKCNSTENGINIVTTVKPINVFINECAVYNCRGTAFNCDPVIADSRSIQINNCSAWHDTSTGIGYDNTHYGFYIGSGAADTKISGCEAMAFKRGFCMNAFTMLENCHSWCGGLHVHNDPSLFRDSIAFECHAQVIATNIFGDTCWVAVTAHGNAKVSVKNFFFYYDDSLSSDHVNMIPLYAGADGSIVVDGGEIDDPSNRLFGIAAQTSVKVRDVVVRTSQNFANTPNIAYDNDDAYYVDTNGTSLTEIASIYFPTYGYAHLKVGTSGGFVSDVYIKFGGGVQFIIEKHWASYGVVLRYKVEGNYVKLYTTNQTNFMVRCVDRTWDTRVMNYMFIRNVNGSEKSRETETEANTTLVPVSAWPAT